MDFRVPTAIKDKMTGVASSGFDCNYSVLGVEKTHDKDASLRLCGALVLKLTTFLCIILNYCSRTTEYEDRYTGCNSTRSAMFHTTSISQILLICIG